jgi:glycosyltransferase involved in cell wall biosynthesis
MNILLIANSSEIGGGNRSLELLALGLRAKGFGVLIVLPQSGPIEESLKANELDVLVQPCYTISLSNVKKSVVGTYSWVQIIRQYNIDIVHANGCGQARSVSFAAKLKRIPVICHVRFLMNDNYLRWVFRFVPKPNCFIYVSQSLADDVIPVFKSCGIRSKNFIIHNAVVVSDREIVYRDEEIKNVGMVANFQEFKGHEDFIYMAKLLAKTNNNLMFHLCGGDVYGNSREIYLKMFVENCGISHLFSFHGFVDDVIKFIDSMDVIVCPSHDEAFGRSAIEAMARGKPVVVTNVGGLAEIVEDGVNGFIVPPKNPEKLADSVDTLLNEIDISVISKNNIKKVNSMFSADVHVRRMIDIYKRFFRR